MSIALYKLFELPVTVLVIAALIPSVSVEYKRPEPCAMLVANPMISAARSAVPPPHRRLARLTGHDAVALDEELRS
ncbi:hypothetical protein JWH05_18860 [Xanthomonas melonis]|nr:hypothetical protein [Xanthomonas melonis]